MATFLPGQTDQPAQQHLYQPDYGFLASVMGTKQQQYDQGFAKVKSLYSSLLNSPVTNQENQQYRDDVFRKLETQLRSVSGADLSQSSNISKAKNLFKPLLEDTDLQADMVLTNRLGTELAKADSYMNSADPEQRAKYSDLSRQDLLYTRQQLAEAKRGNGSVQQVQAREFTPFEDVKGFLDKQAKEQGFKVVHDTQRGFYLVKTTNGPGTVPLFDSWAKQAMGTRFDRQFQVEARVGLERGLRGLMNQTQGLTREQAQQSLAQTYAQTAVQDLDVRLRRTSTDLDAVETALGHFKNKQSIPASQKAQYEQLIQARDELSQQVKNYEQNKADYQNPERLNVLSATLPSVLTEQLKARTSAQWANTHARLTQEEEIRPDQVRLTEFTQQQENFRQGRSLAQAAQFKSIDVKLAQQEFGLKAAKTQYDMQLDQAKFQQAQHEFSQMQQVREGQLAVNEYVAGIKGFSAVNGKGAGAGGKAIPGVSLTGSYTTPQTTTAVDVLHQERAALFQDMYQSTFALKDSPLAVFYPEGSARQDIADVASKLMDLREGRGATFKPSERRAFEQFTKRFHVGATLSQNPQHAHELLQVMSAAMARQLPSHMAAGVNAGEYTPTQAKTVLRSTAALLSGQAQENLIRNRLSKISSLMRDESGQLKSQYEGATQIGVDAKGLPLYDASTVKDKAAKSALNTAADQATLNKTRLSGNSYQVNLPEENILTALSKGNHILSIQEGVNGQLKDVTGDYVGGKDTQAARLLNLPATGLQAAIGKTMEMRVDPATNTSTFVLKVDPKAGYSTPKTGLLGQQTTVEIKVNNDQLRKLQLPARYQQVLDANTPKWGSLGRIIGLDEGKGGKAPAQLRAMGMDFSVSEQNTGGGGRQTVIRFQMKNPVAGGQKIEDQFVTIPGSLSDRDVAQQADQLLTQYSEGYLDWAHQTSKQHHAAQPQIPTHTLPQ